MGSNFDDAQWHVYVAGDFVEETKSEASLSVECCMTSLHREHSQHFFRENSQEEGLTAVPFVSSEKQRTTLAFKASLNRFRSTITSLNRAGTP